MLCVRWSLQLEMKEEEGRGRSEHMYQRNGARAHAVSVLEIARAVLETAAL